MNTTYTDIIVFFVGFGASWIVFTTIYRRFTVEVFRQRMFQLRDSLFDYAADGNVEFNDQAYLLLRTTMNGFIRYGHKISFFELLVLRAGTKKIITQQDSFSKKWNKVLHGAPAKRRQDLERFRSRMNELIVLQAFAGSPFFLCTVIAPIAAFAIPAHLYSQMKKIFFLKASLWLKNPIDSVESAALVYGR